jgi:hypothetical protein
MLELTATPQIREPTSKVKRKARNVHLSEKYWKSLPEMGWSAQLRVLLMSRKGVDQRGRRKDKRRRKRTKVTYMQIKNAEPYHPTSSKLLNAVVIVGIAFTPFHQ